MKLMSATKTQVKILVNKNTSVVAYHIWYFVFSYNNRSYRNNYRHPSFAEKFWDEFTSGIEFSVWFSVSSLCTSKLALDQTVLYQVHLEQFAGDANK